MNRFKVHYPFLGADFASGVAIFLVALPLCLGIALASGAPLFAGLIAGIVGGLLVSLLSGSHTSVSGPAAGLAIVVLSAIQQLGDYSVFLLAVMLAGGLQMLLGLVRAGIIADYFPSNVIKGLLSAIGIILILKQIPHALGYDADAVGEFNFLQADQQNTFSELWNILDKVEPGAAFIGILSVLLMLLWDKITPAKRKALPAPVVVVGAGIVLSLGYKWMFPAWILGPSHLVTVPVTQDFSDFLGYLDFPDFSAFTNPDVYVVAITLAIVASLETLLNLQAVDKLDPEKRYSPPNRELLAQGAGNMLSGLIGGLPITSVVVRSSVNINAGGRTRAASFIHGILLLLAVIAIPHWINKIPLACLAGILIVTGYKLAKLSLFKEMYQRGAQQFVPFISTIIGIVFTDLLVGILFGLGVSVFFILKSNFQNPFNHIREHHHVGEIIRLELAQQVTFLNKASLMATLNELPAKTQVVIDAQDTEFIDFDILELIDDFVKVQAPTKNIQVSLEGFKDAYNYNLSDHIHFMSTPTPEIQASLSPDEIITLLKAGNQRFVKNERIHRNLMQQVKETTQRQHPLAAILSCIDSRTTSELIFDLGLGDIFSVRMAGNVVNEDVIGSLEYACKVAGAKLLVVLAHTNCGAIKSACDGVRLGHISRVLEKIEPAIQAETTVLENRNSKNKEFVFKVTSNHIGLTKSYLLEKSDILREMVDNGGIKLIGGLYDLATGTVHFDTDPPAPRTQTGTLILAQQQV